MQGALALIPARGGSKRIPRKNIRPFLGVPLLHRTVKLILGTGLFARVVVSTDDDEIAQVAIAAGAEVPFRRPAELATDTAQTIPVVTHGIRQLEASGSFMPEICCVYPAAVLARGSDIQGAREMLSDKDVDYVFPVTGFEYPIQRAVRVSADGSCRMFWPEHAQSRSQDLEPAYHDVGQFYWGTRDAWLEGRPLFSRRSRVLIVANWRVRDIDTEEDWKQAEMIFQSLQRDA